MVGQRPHNVGDGPERVVGVEVHRQFAIKLERVNYRATPLSVRCPYDAKAHRAQPDVTRLGVLFVPPLGAEFARWFGSPSRGFRRYRIQFGLTFRQRGDALVESFTLRCAAFEGTCSKLVGEVSK